MEATRSRILTRDLVMCALFAALGALSAFFKISVTDALPAFTLQTMFVALAGYILGGKLAALSQTVYVLLGLIGLPVFTQGGGPAYLLKPSFGYLLGFILGGYVIGYLAKRLESKGFWGMMLAGVAGLSVIYIMGAAYMYLIVNLYLGRAMTVWGAIYGGMLIFLPADLATCAFAAILARKLRPIYKRMQ